MFFKKKKKEIDQVIEQVVSMADIVLTRVHEQDKKIDAILEIMAEKEEYQAAQQLSSVRKLLIIESILRENKLDDGKFDITIN